MPPGCASWRWSWSGCIACGQMCRPRPRTRPPRLRLPLRPWPPRQRHPSRQSPRAPSPRPFPRSRPTRPPEPPWRSGSARAGPSGSAALALALGGLLLVRYSIEQGVFGPGVRVALGALFALALVAAGEWFRRTERRLPVEAIPAAHVPSMLTAAGTASAFGTVYAAHALYGFIGPAAAFVLLGAHRRRHHAGRRAARAGAGRPRSRRLAASCRCWCRRTRPIRGRW